MKIDKNKLLQTLKADLKAAEVLKKDQDCKILRWKNAYDGKPYGNETKGKSQIVSRDIKKQSEWQHAYLIDPFVSTANVIKCTPITFEDTASARQNELLLNTQFVRKFDRHNFITDAVNIIDIEGTVVVQTGWDYEEETVLVEREVISLGEDGEQPFIEVQEVEEIVVVKNQPTAVVRRNEDIYLDPTCQGNMSNAQFVIVRYESDLSTLRKDKRNKNLNIVAASGDDEDADYREEDLTNFKFTDTARKKLVVYEYWGNYDLNEDGIAEPMVCMWVGDTIIRLEDNPYPDKALPFIVTPMSKIPFQLHGEASAEFIGDNQKVKTAIIRGFIDNMAASNNGQVGVKKGALDIANRRKYLAGQNFEFNDTPNDFWQGSYNNLPSAAFDMLGLMNNEIESITGVKSFSGGITGNSLGATATGARGAMDATSMRKMAKVRNIAENLVKPLMRKWMAYNAEFLEEEEVVRVTNEEFVPIRRDDLAGKVDIEISINTAEDNAAKSQELSFLLQTIGPGSDPAVTRELTAQVMELSRLPEQAEWIRQYKPEPDPVQQEIQQLELQKLKLENAKLESDILRNEGRANEDYADRDLKLAKTEFELAKTAKLVSEKDKLDLDFIKEDQGVNHKEKLEIEDFKRKVGLDQMIIQSELGGKNEQIGVPN